MKKTLAKMILRWELPRFSGDAHPFNRLLADAIQLQLGRITDETFRLRLEAFYRDIEPDSIKSDIELATKAKRLEKPDGYKIGISAIASGPAVKPGRFDLWARRFGLLGRIGIRSDVLILRRGERIPPHGHHRVVSGFYVLEGRVAIRHYDRVGQTDNGLLVRKALDATLGPGGFTTNSESFHNVHWLQGLAEKSFLFRVTVVDTPSTTAREVGPAESRLYIDPTGTPDPNGLIAAPYVPEAQAKQLEILPSH